MTRTNTTKQFLTKKELADYLGLSVFTIDSWVSQRREVSFVKMGRRVMFDMEYVQTWVEENKHQPREFADWRPLT